MEEDSVVIEEKRRSSVIYVNKILSGSEEIPNFSVFSNACEGLFESAENVGLSEEDLHKATTLLTTFDLDFRHFSFLIGCLIPELRMPKEVVEKMVKWLLKHFWKDSHVSKSNVVLQWLASGLQYGVIDKKPLQAFFLFIFNILKKFSLSKSVSSVVSLVAEPDYFSQNHVNILLDLQEKATKVRTPPMQFTYLLRLIKTSRPELVPFEVHHTAGIMALLAGNKFNFTMDVVRKRLTGESVMDVSEISRTKRWEAELNEDLTLNESAIVHENHGSKDNKKEPLVAPIQVTSKLAPNQPGKLNSVSITEISSYEELGRNWNNLVVPDNIISLLRHEYGLYMLAFGSGELQQRFIHTLHANLQNKVLFKQYTSPNEVDMLLKLIVRFEIFIQQGLSAVSQFLRCYVPLWNGLDYRTLILKLIAWMTFDKYDELNHFCLLPLYYLFISTPVDFKCEILQCLTSLISNMVTFTLTRHKQKVGFAFLPETSAPDWVSDPDSTIINVIDFVEQLIKIALLQEPCDVFLLNTVYDFYDKVQLLKEEDKINCLIIIPSFLVHQSLLCNTVEPLNRAASLLLRYRRSALLLTDQERRDLETETIMMEKNVQDIYWTLFKRQGLSTTFVDRTLLDLMPHANIEEALSHHLMFTPHISFVKEGNDSLNYEEAVFEVLKVYSPALYELISLCKENNV